MTIGDRIKRRRKELSISAETIAEFLNVSPATVYRYEKGDIEKLPGVMLEPLAKILKTTPAYLMGWEQAVYKASNLSYIGEMKKIPLLGSIACGEPILAEQNIADHIDLPGHISADFALTCKGDSMINAGIRDGDIVYIRHQPEVDNGQIAAVMVGDSDATLKRFYRDGDKVILVAENAAYPPKTFVGSELEQLRIIGLAVAYTHLIEI